MGVNSTTGNQVVEISGSVIATSTLSADARAGQLYAKTVTLGTANTVQQFTIPSGSMGFRLYSTSDILFNINAAPTAPIATDVAGGAISMTASSVGNIARAGAVETRLIASTASALYVASSTASAVVTVEFF